MPDALMARTVSSVESMLSLTGVMICSEVIDIVNEFIVDMYMRGRKCYTAWRCVVNGGGLSLFFIL